MLRTDESGKITLDHIYDQDDPRAYFDTLRGLGYCIPQLAKPHFLRLIDNYRHTRGVDAPTVVDIGCSYGINAALLRCDASMSELFARYCNRTSDARAALVSRDLEFVRIRQQPSRPRFVGLDSSPGALSYALEAGFIDTALHADLESGDLAEDQRTTLASADVVISTGCVGYVTDRTTRASPPPTRHDGRGWRTSCCGCFLSTRLRRHSPNLAIGPFVMKVFSGSGGSPPPMNVRASSTAWPTSE